MIKYLYVVVGLFRLSKPQGRLERTHTQQTDLNLNYLTTPVVMVPWREISVLTTYTNEPEVVAIRVIKGTWRCQVSLEFFPCVTSLSHKDRERKVFVQTFIKKKGQLINCFFKTWFHKITLSISVIGCDYKYLYL